MLFKLITGTITNVLYFTWMWYWLKLYNWMTVSDSPLADALYNATWILSGVWTLTTMAYLLVLPVVVAWVTATAALRMNTRG